MAGEGDVQEATVNIRDGQNGQTEHPAALANTGGTGNSQSVSAVFDESSIQKMCLSHVVFQLPGSNMTGSRHSQLPGIVEFLVVVRVGPVYSPVHVRLLVLSEADVGVTLQLLPPACSPVKAEVR